jgi:hypothetical protein
MKTQKKIRSKLASLNNNRWAAYATAAIATSFAAGYAEADIHYSGIIHQNVSGRNGRVTVPVGTGGAVMVFRHGEAIYGSSNIHIGGDALFSIYGASGAVAAIPAPGSDSISKLSPRDAISTRSFQASYGLLAARSGGTGGPPEGQFLDRGYGFLAFRFNSGAGDQYGWARVRMLGLPENRYFVEDFAYADPGESILAGQKSRSGLAMESLGGLSFGASALSAWRESQLANSAPEGL